MNAALLSPISSQPIPSPSEMEIQCTLYDLCCQIQSVEQRVSTQQPSFQPLVFGQQQFKLDECIERIGKWSTRERNVTGAASPGRMAISGLADLRLQLASVTSYLDHLHSMISNPVVSNPDTHGSEGSIAPLQVRNETPQLVMGHTFAPVPGPQASEVFSPLTVPAVEKPSPNRAVPRTERVVKPTPSPSASRGTRRQPIPVRANREVKPESGAVSRQPVNNKLKVTEPEQSAAKKAGATEKPAVTARQGATEKPVLQTSTGSTRRPWTVFDEVLRNGYCDNFYPRDPEQSTDAPPGSEEKIKVLRRRLERGEGLWHDQDRHDFEGFSRSFQPFVDEAEVA